MFTDSSARGEKEKKKDQIANSRWEQWGGMRLSKGQHLLQLPPQQEVKCYQPENLLAFKSIQCKRLGNDREEKDPGAMNGGHHQVH